MNITKLKELKTPLYYYDTALLKDTLAAVTSCAKEHNYHVHYALKANTNPELLRIIRRAGLGVDCVSGGEILAALEAGFSGIQIVYAGVGKADWEIELALDSNILCFNVESIAELEVINQIAAAKNKVARVALRINPEVDAHTHHYITTGLKENKFGISLAHLDRVLGSLHDFTHIKLTGLHFHIGSQITELNPFELLSDRINEIQNLLDSKSIKVKIINVGGGLGIDYNDPDANPIPDFESYFKTFTDNLKLRKGQELHFELGRSIVGQCASLITKVLYVKEGVDKKFVIVDAGMTDLIRPALYDAYHKIENLTSSEPEEIYDVVGPVCESSDSFASDIALKGTRRGDLLALRSAGAYGEVMAMTYNCRELPKAYYSSKK